MSPEVLTRITNEETGSWRSAISFFLPNNNCVAHEAVLGGDEKSPVGWSWSSVLGSFRTAALKAPHFGNFAQKQMLSFACTCFWDFFKTRFFLVKATHSKPPDFSRNATKQFGRLGSTTKLHPKPNLQDAF